MKVIEIIRNERLKRYLSQKELAKKIGVTVTTYNYWETGRFSPTLKNIEIILDFFEKEFEIKDKDKVNEKNI